MKNLEKRLTESARKYQELFESSRDGIFVVDKDGSFIDANNAYCAMLGYTIDELKEMENFLYITPERWHEYEWEIIWKQKLLKTGFSGIYEKEYIRKNGEVFPVELQSFTTFDDNHEPRYLWGVARDISERKRAKSILLERARLSAIGELAAGVAHDFNNALQSIIGNVELALFKKIDDQELERYLSTIKISALDAASRVKKLQTFAQHKDGRKDFVALDINEMIKEVIGQTKYLWKDAQEKIGNVVNINLVLESQGIFKGDPGNLRSVFFNIIKNAIEAMPTGGDIKIESDNDQDWIYVKVSDNGIGMDKNTRDRIFQPFLQRKDLKWVEGWA